MLDDLLERSQQLPEVSEATREFISTSQSAHHGLQEKAQAFVEAYEAAVANHQQYMKAVMELGEWMTATHNTIEMWSDASLERLSLHANLERIKSMQGCNSIDILGTKLGTKLGTRTRTHPYISCPVSCPECQLNCPPGSLA